MVKTRKRAQRIRRTRKVSRSMKQRGGLIEEYEGVFDSLEDRWVLTGSEAVRLLTQHLGLADAYPIQPNDLDLLFVGDEDALGRRIGGFIREGPHAKSMTYTSSSGLSFDITVVPSVSYYVINGLRILNPKEMLRTYEDDLALRGSKDQIKVDALREIVQHLDNLERKTMSVRNTRKRNMNFGNTARSLF
jgi:hypothetical protein